LKEIESIHLEADTLICEKVYEKEMENYEYTSYTVIVKSQAKRATRHIQTLEDLSTREWTKVEDILIQEWVKWQHHLDLTLELKVIIKKEKPISKH
jgi:hypothetical protein